MKRIGANLLGVHVEDNFGIRGVVVGVASDDTLALVLWPERTTWIKRSFLRIVQ